MDPGYTNQQPGLAPAGTTFFAYHPQQPGLAPAGATYSAYHNQQPGQPFINYVVNQQNTGYSVRYPRYNGKVAASFGGLQIFLGVLSVAMSSAVLGIGGYNMPSQYNVGYGIWSPVFWFIAGAFGLGAAKVKTECMIITTMVMSIMSALTIVHYLSLQSIAVSESNTYDRDEAIFALSVALLIVCMAEGTIAILAACQCCKTVCCCRNNAVSITAAQIAALNLENPTTIVFHQAPPMQPAVAAGSAYTGGAPTYAQHTQDTVKNHASQASPPLYSN